MIYQSNDYSSDLWHMDYLSYTHTISYGCVLKYGDSLPSQGPERGSPQLKQVLLDGFFDPQPFTSHWSFIDIYREPQSGIMASNHHPLMAFQSHSTNICELVVQANAW